MPLPIVSAEDDAAILDTLTRTLAGEGDRVRPAGEGAAHTVRLGVERANLLRTAQRLPRVTGLAVSAGLPARAGAILPISVMSARTLPLPPAAPRSSSCRSRSTGKGPSRRCGRGGARPSRAGAASGVGDA